jgi:hypothetical protein
MKKSFIAVLAVFAALMFVSPSMACEGPQCGPSTVNGSYEAQAYTSDYAFDTSPNDLAEAGGQGVIEGQVSTYANANGGHWEITGWNWIFPQFDFVPNTAFEQGSLHGTVDVDAFANTHDFGTTSIAVAGSSYEGSIFGEGLALGENGCREWVSVVLSLAGNIYQQNSAREIDYPENQGIGGGGFSSVEFHANTGNFDKGRDFAMAVDRLGADASTFGRTQVTIDPYGNSRSFSGTTYNTASFDTTGRGYATVSGNGGLSGLIANGLSYAGATASFTYGGNTDTGNGNAMINANIITNSSSTIVNVSGSSSATTGVASQHD